MKDVGNVRKIAQDIPEGDSSVVDVATILGRVNSIGFHDNPNGATPSKSLGGVFEVTPMDPARAVIFGERIFLPPALCEQIASRILAGKEKLIPTAKPEKGKVITVAGAMEIPITVIVSIRKSNSAVGYEWAVSSVQDDKDAMAAVDPFAGQRSLLTGRAATATQAALPAPEKTKARKRK